MISIYKGQWDTSGKWHLRAITWGAYSSQWTLEWIWWVHFDQATRAYNIVRDLWKVSIICNKKNTIVTHLNCHHYNSACVYINLDRKRYSHRKTTMMACQVMTKLRKVNLYFHICEIISYTQRHSKTFKSPLIAHVYIKLVAWLT